MKIKSTRIWMGFLVLLWLIGATACVQREEYRAWQGEVRRTTVEQSQQIRGLNDRVTALEQSATADIGKQLADHLNDFTVLQEEVAALRGQVETFSYRRETQIQRDLEHLKRKIEQQEGAQVPTTAPPQVSTPAPPPVQPEPAPVDRVEELYKEARFSFEEGNYKEAREMFNAILQRHPDSALVDNAQFWVGECYFREGDFKQAILEYEKMISQYPQSLKVPSAYLKQGMAFEKLGDAESARFLYSKITKDYPDSDQAPMAAHRLKNLP